MKKLSGIEEIREILKANPCHHKGLVECVLCDIWNVVQEEGRPKRKVYEGTLWCDIDDGWVLKGDSPKDTKDIGREIFGRMGVEGKRVRITLEVLRKIRKCPSCGHAQSNGPETTSGKCLDCDRTSPSTGAHLR